MIINDNILSFDFGVKTIGTAISQLITCIVRPLIIYKIKNNKINWILINNLLYKWKPKLVIVGLPLNNNSNKNFIINLIKNFANILKKKYNICVILHNENYTTKYAKTKLFKYKGHYILKRSYINTESAVIILESWLQQIL